MKLLGILVVLVALAGACGTAAAATAPPADAAALSFAELYRLTTSGVSGVDFETLSTLPGEAPAALPRGEVQVRPVSSVAVSAVLEPAQPGPAIYSVSAVPFPEPSSRWLLLASGLALAAWVARRRLGYSL